MQEIIHQVGRQVVQKLKGLFAIALILLGIGLINSVPGLTPTAFATEMANGAQIFQVHCVGCHVNGGNIVRRGKNLKLRTLQRQQLDTVESIGHLVTNGRGIMSAYGDRLSAAEIQAVSTYVLEQAQQGWSG